MHRLALILAFCSLNFLIVSAQSANLDAIDQYVHRVSSQTQHKSLPEIVQVITKPATSSTEKARSIFTWIALNISYDTNFLSDQANADPCVSVECVLENRKSVCAGYAELFQKMCAEAGLTSYIVEGYVKGYGYENRPFDRANHAWNVLKIGFNWYLVDVTWGSGTISGTNQFQFDFADEYFMMDPQELVLTHLPADPIFQLSDSPVPMKVWEQGEQAIATHIKRIPARLDHKKALTRYERTPLVEARFRSAVRAYKFNKRNIHDYAYACMNYADKLSQTKRLRHMKEESFATVLVKADEHYRIANALFAEMDDEFAKHNQIYCKDRIQHMGYRLGQLRALASSK